MICFHLGHFKHFYIRHIQVNCKGDFPKTVSYNRFVELQQKILLPMTVFLQMCCLGKCTGISFIDSTSIRVCHIKREYSNKTFKGIATKGKTSIGWFFGFKLHIVINDKGEILDFLITQANVDDRKTKYSIKKCLAKYLQTGGISQRICLTICLLMAYILLPE